MACTRRLEGAEDQRALVGAGVQDRLNAQQRLRSTRTAVITIAELNQRRHAFASELTPPDSPTITAPPPGHKAVHSLGRAERAHLARPADRQDRRSLSSNRGSGGIALTGPTSSSVAVVSFHNCHVRWARRGHQTASRRGCRRILQAVGRIGGDVRLHIQGARVRRNCVKRNPAAHNPSRWQAHNEPRDQLWFRHQGLSVTSSSPQRAEARAAAPASPDRAVADGPPDLVAGSDDLQHSGDISHGDGPRVVEVVLSEHSQMPRRATGPTRLRAHDFRRGTPWTCRKLSAACLPRLDARAGATSGSGFLCV